MSSLSENNTAAKGIAVFFYEVFTGTRRKGRDKVRAKLIMRKSVALSSTLKRQVINVGLLLASAGLAWMVYLQLQEDQVVSETLYQDSIGESMQQISIVLPGLPEILIEAEAAGDKDLWKIVKPVQVSANTQSLQHLFTLLSEPILAEYPAADKDLNTFGLAESAIKLRFNSVEYRLGKLNPVNHRRYILLEGRILMVNEAVYELLMRGVDGFKEKG